MLYASGAKALWQSSYTATTVAYGGLSTFATTHVIATNLGLDNNIGNDTVAGMDLNAAGTGFFDNFQYVGSSHAAFITEDGLYLTFVGYPSTSAQGDYIVRNTTTNALLNVAGREGDVPYSFTGSNASILAPMLSGDAKTLVAVTNRPFDTALDSGVSTSDVYAKKLTLLDLLSDTGTGGAGDISFHDNITSTNTNLLLRANNLVAGNQVLLMEGSTVVSGAAPSTVNDNGFAEFTVASASAGVHTYVVADITGTPYTSGLFDNALKVTVL
jgi:hypothetical protein